MFKQYFPQRYLTLLKKLKLISYTQDVYLITCHVAKILHYSRDLMQINFACSMFCIPLWSIGMSCRNVLEMNSESRSSFQYGMNFLFVFHSTVNEFFHLLGVTITIVITFHYKPQGTIFYWDVVYLKSEVFFQLLFSMFNLKSNQSVKTAAVKIPIFLTAYYKIRFRDIIRIVLLLYSHHSFFRFVSGKCRFTNNKREIWSHLLTNVG